MRIHNFFFQQIFLVKEEDDRWILKPGICDDRLKQCFTLFHTVLMEGIKMEWVSYESTKNPRTRHSPRFPIQTKFDHIHLMLLKKLLTWHFQSNGSISFALISVLQHQPFYGRSNWLILVIFLHSIQVLPKDDWVQIKGILNDSCRRDSNPKDVLLSRQVVWLGYSIDVAEITVGKGWLIPISWHNNPSDLLFGRVCELIFSPTIITFLNSWICPKVFDGFNVWSIKGCYCLIINCSDQLGIFLKTRDKSS